VSHKVYDQGDCGSCWAFSFAGMMESRIALHQKKEPHDLSRQQILDCVSPGSCQSGNHLYALQYALKSSLYGIDEYDAYSGVKGKCNTQKIGETHAMRYNFVQNFIIHQKVTAVELKYLLLKGPISVSIDAKQFEFVFYKSGVVRYNCTAPNHSILLIGYNDYRGVSNKVWNYYKPYWILRNSWGQDWGLNGSIRIEMDDLWDGCGMYSNVLEFVK